MSDDRWFNIRWYRDYYDVPRLLCVEFNGGVIVFDSPFNDAIDDYNPMYAAYWLPELGKASECELIEFVTGSTPIAKFEVATFEFDASGRQSVRLPVNLLEKLGPVKR